MSRKLLVAGALGTLSFAANVVTLADSGRLDGALHELEARGDMALVALWTTVFLLSVLGVAVGLLNTQSRRRMFATLIALVIGGTLAIGCAGVSWQRRGALALLVGTGLVLSVAALIVGNASKASTVPSSVGRESLERLGRPLHNLLTSLGLANGTEARLPIVLGVAALVAWSFIASVPSGGAMAVGHVIATEGAGVVAETEAVPREGQDGDTTSTVIEDATRCSYDFGEGEASADLAAALAQAGAQAQAQYRACAIGPVRRRQGDWLFEQRAFTADSARARLVGWLDLIGEARATFVTSDEANGYSRWDPDLSWRELGLPVPWESCNGRPIQRFVTRSGRTIAVGVHWRADKLTRADEAIYVPPRLFGAWLMASVVLGKPVTPAGQATRTQSGHRQQFILEREAPLVEVNLPEATASELVQALCH